MGQQWPSLKERSESLRLSLHQLSPALEKPQRHSREPSARQRSLLLLKEKTGRTRTACPSSPLSILPSSARPSKSLRRLRREPSLPWFCKPRMLVNQTKETQLETYPVQPGTELNVGLSSSLIPF